MPFASLWGIATLQLPSPDIQQNSPFEHQQPHCHIVLEDEPHALYVILDIPPVTERVEITKVKAILLTLNNAYDCKGNLAGYEGLASTLALVIEKDA